MLHAGAEGSGVVLFQGAAEEVEMEDSARQKHTSDGAWIVIPQHSNPELLTACVTGYRLYVQGADAGCLHHLSPSVPWLAPLVSSALLLPTRMTCDGFLAHALDGAELANTADSADGGLVNSNPKIRKRATDPDNLHVIPRERFSDFHFFASSLRIQSSMASRLKRQSLPSCQHGISPRLISR